MDEIRTKLEAELRQAVRRLRQMGGAVAAEDLPGAIGDNSPFADEVDEIQANESRELGFATRTLLVERVNRLADALERPPGRGARAARSRGGPEGPRPWPRSGSRP